MHARDARPRCTPVRYTPIRGAMYAYEVHTYEVYIRDFDLSLTAPMSCHTGRHTTVLGGIRWCFIVPSNGSLGPALEVLVGK
jgi:hypothetical protein